MSATGVIPSPRQIQAAVPIEIAQSDQLRITDHRVTHGWRKCAGSVTDQDRDSAAGVIGGCDIEFAVAVEVAELEPAWEVTRSNLPSPVTSAIATSDTCGAASVTGVRKAPAPSPSRSVTLLEFEGG